MMFSKEYFKYLFRSKKYLLLLVFLITLLNCFISDDKRVAVYIQAIFSVILSYVITVDVFFYVHDRKAVDSYFTLPVSRRTLLLTGIAFAFLVTYLPLAVSIAFFSLGKGLIGFMCMMLIKMALASLCIVIIHAAVYLIANNILDGIVMLGAYSMYPLFLLVTAETFLWNYVCGSRSFDLSIIGYLSPVYMAYVLFSPISELKLSPDQYVPAHLSQIPALAMMLVMTAVAAYVLYKNHVERRTERAGMPSKNFFSYPFVISIYVFMVLMFFISMYEFRIYTIPEFLKDSIFVYLLLFAVYVTAVFLYRRKFYISWRMLLGFVMALLISIGMAKTAIATRGFGLSDSYDPNDPDLEYALYSWADNYGKVQANQELFDYLDGYTVNKNEYLNISVVRKSKNIPLRQSSIDMFDGLRKKAIDNFYARKTDAEEYWNVHMDVLKDGISHYGYDMVDQLSIAELKELAKDEGLTVSFDVADGVYQMDSEGQLVLVKAYEE